MDSANLTNGALLSWSLQTTTSSTNANLIVLTNDVLTNLAPGAIAYFGVDVPVSASFATNVLFNVTGGTIKLFDQSALPTGGLPGDVTLFNGAGTNVLSIQGAPPPLEPGQRYFLGVQNTSTNAETFSLEVEFNVSGPSPITPLTNGTPLDPVISPNQAQSYSFVVPTNVCMVTFQVLNVSPVGGEVDLYAREGLPLPGPYSFDYESDNAGAGDQFIVVTTNSQPVPLPAAGGGLPQSSKTWYLTVTNSSGVPNVTYTILATYMTNGGGLGGMTVINLNNETNFTYVTNAPPSYPGNLVYSFTTAGNALGVRFMVTNLSGAGNVELLADTNVFPTTEDFYDGSFNPGHPTSSLFPSAPTPACRSRPTSPGI